MSRMKIPNLGTLYLPVRGVSMVPEMGNLRLMESEVPSSGYGDQRLHSNIGNSANRRSRVPCEGFQECMSRVLRSQAAHFPTKPCSKPLNEPSKGRLMPILVGGVIKQGVARKRQGKSGDFRTIILYRTGGHAFFVYGFAESDWGNIGDDEEVQFQKAAVHVLELTDEQLGELIG